MCDDHFFVADADRASHNRQSGAEVIKSWTWWRLVPLLCAIASVAPVVSAQTLHLVSVGSIPGPADWIEVKGAYAYVAAEKTFTVFDITDTAAPKRQGSYTFPERIWGFRVVGSLVYVAADVFGLGILDVSNPAEPSLRGAFKTPGQAKNVALFGTKALVADHMSGLDILDVSNAAKPASLGSFFLEGYSRDVVIANAFAYAVDAPSGLYVFDLSKADPLEPVSTLQSPNSDRGSPLHPSIELPAASTTELPTIACVVRSQSLQVYDISNPRAPVSVATYRTPSGRPQRVALSDKLAYVADGQEGLLILDLATPANPTIVGTFKTPSPARDVTVADSLVFVVIGDLRSDSRSPSGREVLILRRNP
jgi:hypothetical protein